MFSSYRGRHTATDRSQMEISGSVLCEIWTMPIDVGFFNDPDTGIDYVVVTGDTGVAITPRLTFRRNGAPVPYVDWYTGFSDEDNLDWPMSELSKDGDDAHAGA